MSGSAQHPIRVVSRRTGLSLDTLRAWERRYGAVSPRRSESGRRLYSDLDLQRLVLLRRLTDSGRRISDVAGLSMQQLRDLDRPQPNPTDRRRLRLLEDPAGPGSPRQDHEAGSSKSEPVDGASRIAWPQLDRALAALEALDTDALEKILGRAHVELGTIGLITQLLVPLLDETGKRWRDGRLRIVHEHMASVAVRGLVQTLSVAQPRDASAPAVVATTPAGQRHEIGALMAGVLAATRGWRVLYLGPDLPAEEISAAVRQTGARALFLGLTYPADDPRLPGELQRLRRLLPDRFPVIAGGGASEACARILDRLGIHRLERLEEITPLLDILRVEG